MMIMMMMNDAAVDPTVDADHADDADDDDDDDDDDDEVDDDDDDNDDDDDDDDVWVCHTIPANIITIRLFWFWNYLANLPTGRLPSVLPRGINSGKLFSGHLLCVLW